MCSTAHNQSMSAIRLYWIARRQIEIGRHTTTAVTMPGYQAPEGSAPHRQRLRPGSRQPGLGRVRRWVVQVGVATGVGEKMTTTERDR